MRSAMLTCARLVAAALAVASCVRFDTFVCSEPDACVLAGVAGRCESSGYCSFPDGNCASGYRYSDHAPSSLVRRCVEPDADETSSTAAVGTQSGDSSSDEGPSACVDVDGDGAGAGCPASDCDDDNPSVTDACVYLGPGGDDAAAGTRDAPWATFAFAIAMLHPGDSLVLLDGTYDGACVGTLEVDCTAGAPQGTTTAPIFVRAENDRQAVLDRGSAHHGIRLLGCTDWRVRGLAVVGADGASDAGGAWREPVLIQGSRAIEIRQVFASHANRYFNEHVFSVLESESVLLEDVEAHDFFRFGFSFYGSRDVTCRRCYGNSHGATDLPACPDLPDCADPVEQLGTLDCPRCSSAPDRGDSTFFVQYSSGIHLENCVSEGSRRGFEFSGGLDGDGEPAGDGSEVLQSISIDDETGLHVVSGGDTPVAFVGLRVEDLAVLSARGTGILVREPDGLALRDVTVLGAASTGISVDSALGTACTAGACSLTIERALVLGAGGAGISLADELTSWTLADANVFGSNSADYAYPDLAGDPPDDDAGNAVGCHHDDATAVGLDADECRVYVPATSNLHALARDGSDIGANVVDELVDGAPTGRPLWTDERGFPCGADPRAPEQIAGESCPDLATRAGIGAACPAPPASG